MLLLSRRKNYLLCHSLVERRNSVDLFILFINLLEHLAFKQKQSETWTPKFRFPIKTLIISIQSTPENQGNTTV